MVCCKVACTEPITFITISYNFAIFVMNAVNRTVSTEQWSNVTLNALFIINTHK